MIYKLTYTVFIRCLYTVNHAFKNINSSIPSILTPVQDFFVKSYIASLKFFDGMTVASISDIFHIGLSLTKILQPGVPAAHIQAEVMKYIEILFF